MSIIDGVRRERWYCVLKLPGFIELGGLLVVLCLASAARANMGPEWYGVFGTTAQGGVKEIDIRRETLTLDLRPLVDREPVHVEATYEVYNPGPGRTLHLVFVAGSESVNDFEVRLGGKLLSSVVLSGDEVKWRWETMPANWKTEREAGLPAIGGGRAYAPFHRPGVGLTLIAFQCHVPTGASTIQARYRARAVGTTEGYPTTTWQVLYILAPAREWKSFGQLEVTVRLPANWECLSTTKLERDGDVLRGSFDGIPSDSLIVGARVPVGPWFGWMVGLYILVYILAVLGGGGVCWFFGGWLGCRFARLRSQGAHAWTILEVPTVIFLGLLWGTMVSAAATITFSGIIALPGSQQSPYWGNQFILPFFGSMALSLLLVFVGGGLAAKAMKNAARRASR
jgi:hypothetical protein